MASHQRILPAAYSKNHETAPKVTQASKPRQAPFKVCVRVRPLLSKEVNHTSNYPRQTNSIVRTFPQQDKQLVHIHDSDLIYDNLGLRDRQFMFDEVFSDQETN